MKNDLTSLLADLGLNSNEAKVYLASLRLGRATVSQLSQFAKVKRTSIYNFIDRLLEKGFLVREKFGQKSYYVACPTESLVERARIQVNLLEAALPQLSQLALDTHSPRIVHYHGSKEMLRIFEEELFCKKEILYIWPGSVTYDVIGSYSKIEMIDRERIKRGIKIRSIRFPSQESPYDRKNYGSKFLKEVRYTNRKLSSLMGLVIYDTGKVGFFSSKKESFAVIVESPEMAAFLTMLFEVLWQTSSAKNY